MVNTPNKYLVPGIYLILLLLTLAAFWQVRDCDFITYDDRDYVTHNPNVKEGISRDSIIWAFTGTTSNLWHPLASLSHILDSQIYGLNPAGYHLTSLLFHIANTLLLFRLLSLMTSNVWCSFFVAALFGLHPLHVESVAWVSERKDVLSTFFGLLAMIFYVKYVKNSEFSSQNSEWEKDKSLKIRRRPSSTDYWLLTTVFYILSLLSKSMLVTMPFVLLLLDYWPLGRFGKIRLSRLFYEKVPLFVLSAAVSIVTFFTQHSGGTVSSFKMLPIGYRIANASISYVTYLRKMIYPDDLAIHYQHLGSNVSVFGALVCSTLLVLISIFLVYFGYRKRYLITGWLWYLGMLVPVIGIVQSGPQAMADRYTYLPSIGIFIMACWGMPALFASRRFGRAILGIGGGLILLVCLVLTRIQVSYWQNSFILYEHAIAVTGINTVTGSNYAELLMEYGWSDEAVRYYRQVLQAEPTAAAYNNLGLALVRVGNAKEGLSYFNEAVRLDPNLAVARRNKDTTERSQKDVDEKVKKINEKLLSDPGSSDMRYNLGLMLYWQGRVQEAIEQWNKTIELDPNNTTVYDKLGNVFSAESKFDKAVQYYTIAAGVEPNGADRYYRIGLLLQRQGRTKEAAEKYRKTLQLDPAHPLAAIRLAALKKQLR